MALPLPSTDPHPLAPGLHRTDAFHRRPLLVVEPLDAELRPAWVVSSWNEAHALHGPASPADVNPAYVAALISGNHTAAEAPYRRIRRLPRAHHVLLSTEGAVSSCAYDPFAEGAEAMEPEQLHPFVRQGLLEHVQQALQGHGAFIGCEHSSGLDSNAVLGALVHGAGVAPDRLHTWSREQDGEGPLLRQFRRYHRLHLAHCHRSTSGADGGDPTQTLNQRLKIFGAPPQLGGNPGAVALFGSLGCTLLFSGFGGDQALSHNANNVPTDLVRQQRWRELVRWEGSRRQAMKTAAGRALALAHRPWATRRVRGRGRQICRNDVLRRTLTPEGLAWLGPHLQETYPWELDGYLPLHTSIRRRVLADWVAVRLEEETRLAAAHGMAKAFPLLDERLIGTLLHQDPLYFGEGARRGRLIHRQAFAPFLPPALRDDPTKDREPEGGMAQWIAEVCAQERQRLAHSLGSSANWHPALRRWWNLETIRHQAEILLARDDASMNDLAGTSDALVRLATLSHWWWSLEG